MKYEPRALVIQGTSATWFRPLNMQDLLALKVWNSVAVHDFVLFVLSFLRFGCGCGITNLAVCGFVCRLSIQLQRSRWVLVKSA